jgi:hypothetical protein
MRKPLLLLFCNLILSLYCIAQNNDCDVLFNSAMDYFNKGEYEQALSSFERVITKCGNGSDYRGALDMIQKCNSRLNKTKTPALTIGKTDVSFGPQGGMETIQINSNVSWKYQGPEWLNLSKSKGQLVIWCERNATGAERSADLTISCGEGADKVSKKLHVAQSKGFFRVSKGSVSFTQHGGSDNLQVACSDNWSVVVPEGSWFSAKKMADKIVVSCDENPLVVERHGTFDIKTVYDETVTVMVSQWKSKTRIELVSSKSVSQKAGNYLLKVESNDPNWEPKVISEESSWCKAEKLNDKELRLIVSENDLDLSREARVRVLAGDTYRDVIVTQEEYRYADLCNDYFDYVGGTWRTTKLSVSAFGLGRNGLRVSAYMFRWKVVEVDLLNLNASVTRAFQLSWEPMVRGYLPLQKDGHCWKAYLGMGGRATFVDVPLTGYSNDSNVLFEAGAECKLNLDKRDDISMRVFVRIDRYASMGVAFDMYEWK